MERGTNLLRARIAILVCGFCGVAAAKKLIDTATAHQIEESLSPNSLLNCDLSKTAPALTFRLQMQFGFVASLPLVQLPIKNPKLWGLLRLTPQGGGADAQPAFFLREYDLPRILDPQFLVRFSSSVRAGAGEYDVAATVFDEQRRSCSAEWKVHVNPTREELSVIQPMPPHSVAEVTRGSSPSSRHEAPALGRLTILLHAASSNARQTVLTDADVRMLSGELGAVMERLPARNVRLVVFNLDWQKEYYRQSGFRQEDIDRVTQVLTDVGPGTMDVYSLASVKSSLDMVAGLLNRELTGPAPPDVILFLGPPGLAYNRAAAKAVRTQQKIAPLIFYIEHIGPVWYRRSDGAGVYGIDQESPAPAPPAIDDGTINTGSSNGMPFPKAQMRTKPASSANNEDFNTIRITVAALKGKTLLVQRPLDFARALQNVVAAVDKHQR